MIYLPGSCERCPSLSLISSENCIGGKALCGACGGLVTILPGCAYPEGDVALFHGLSAAVNASELSTSDAWKLHDSVQRARFEGSEPALLALLADCLPLFEPYRQILEANPIRMRQALSMLEAMFRARASVHHASAFHLSATASVSSFQQDMEWESAAFGAFAPKRGG